VVEERFNLPPVTDPPRRLRRARRWAAGLSAGFATFGLFLFLALPSRQNTLSPEDSVFLNELEQRAVQYFADHTDPETGLTRDRAPFDGSASQAPASIAASGFALTAWCIGAERGWLDREEARRRVLTVLRFVDQKVAQEHGWIYHFIDCYTGARVWDCEASTIDTALFLQGALLAREYLKDQVVDALVDHVLGRIDWKWALNGGQTLSHGWRPESGFLESRWDSYCELLGLYLIGIGVPTNALPSSCWRAWRRGPVAVYGTHTFINSPPLFTHQYSHAWFDFRGRHDDFLNYWQNSVSATLAQREWCAALSATFDRWADGLWGLTASDSARGYVGWGGPQKTTEQLDGTIVPCAPGGSLPFAPQECLRVLRKIREIGGARVWGRYGFADAFNPQTGWVSPDVIAIDVGITLAMAENLRSGFCWKYFMRAPEARRAFALTGFKPDTPLEPFRSPVLATAKLGESRTGLSIRAKPASDAPVLNAGSSFERKNPARRGSDDERKSIGAIRPGTKRGNPPVK
jgi:hypothetical protein